jgi:signal recognition particle receptor subunit beta
MALVNHTTREINAKIVYYGPGLCGKTTNIHLIYHRIAPGQRGKLISLSTETDRTLFFDFLPVELGTIKNYKVRFHLYTVPGQVFYNATRKLVLKGADGVIFVADSQRAMLDANIESMTNLRDNFSDQGVNLSDFPMVIQYNKRDLPDVLSVEELNAAINPRKVPFYEAVAMTGDGVLKTFTAISKLVLQDMQKFPERHNFTIGDIIGNEEKKPGRPRGIMDRLPPPSFPEPSMRGAPMAEAKPEMAALEQAVEAGMKVNLGKPFMEEGQIILPFDVMARDREDQFQLRVAIDMDAPMAKRFKIVVKNFKKGSADSGC